MPVFVSIFRYSWSLIAPKPSDCSLKRLVIFSTYSSAAAEKFLTHLHKDQANVEKTLNTVKATLDSRCITQVLERCAIDKPQLGVRFFIWAAFHPTHRHTSYMYSKACKLLDVERNPRIIIDVIHEYRAEGFVVSVKMFKVVLNLCRAAKDANMGLWVLRKMKEFNCRPDTVSYNVVIRLLVEKAQLDEAMGLMREMGLIDLYPDMVTYVSIIKGFCDAGRLDDAFGLIKVMKGHGCVPNAVVYSTLLDGICQHGSLEMALEFLGGMEKENGDCKPNVVTYTTMIKGFAQKGRSMEALRFLDRMDDFGIRPNRVTFAALLDGLCKEGSVEEACKVVDKFSVGGLLYDELYNLLVMSLLREGKHKESEKIFRMMMTRGMRPSGLASSSIIERIISEGRVLDGFFLFDALEKSGNLQAIGPDVCSILLAGLCQENHFLEASKIVSIMIEGRIRLKSPHAGNIIKHLNISGEHDLASVVSSINDRLVPGLLIIARSASKADIFRQQIESGEIKKQYIARAIGVFPDDEQVVNVNVNYNAREGKSTVEVENGSNGKNPSKGKAACTKFTRISTNGTQSIFLCEPITGRTHQIRVHLQFLGHPIANGMLYLSDSVTHRSDERLSAGRAAQLSQGFP